MGVGNDRSKGVYPEEDIIIAASAMQPCQQLDAFTVSDGATSFIKFKIKSDVVAKRTFKLVISRFCSV